MRYRNLYSFFWFGTCLRYLQDASKGTPVKGDGFIEENITSLFQNLDELELRVTERVAEDQLHRIRERLSQYKDEDRLTEEDAHALSKAIRAIRITLEAELQGVGAYMPTPKRLDLEKLLKDVGNLFAPDVFDELPKISRYDFG